MNPAHDERNTDAGKAVASDASISGPNSGELLTTNKNAERLGASSDRSGVSLGFGQDHDADLARIVAAWDELPAVLKAAMLAIVDSAGAGNLGHVTGSEVQNSG